ncbi:hypothetical protein NGRA_1718 [Nosema granulosis]|uniref:Uncharacterized protein n=1 Tax=Nosema granulosis TaxID=83296 RepID=A0A9P6KZ40_9MICR|nr:hypothetical protein NGRA_1718 [Nosema granulosis]
MEEFNEDIKVFLSSPRSFELVEKTETKARRKKKKTVSKKLLIENILMERDFSKLTMRQKILNQKFRDSLGALDDISLINSGIDLVPYNINNKTSLEKFERDLKSNGQERYNGQDCNNQEDCNKEIKQARSLRVKEKKANRGGMISGTKPKAIRKRRKIISQEKLSPAYFSQLYEDSLRISRFDSSKFIIKLRKISSIEDIYRIRIPMWRETVSENPLEIEKMSFDKNADKNAVENDETDVDYKIRMKCNLETPSGLVIRLNLADKNHLEDFSFIRTPLSALKGDTLFEDQQDFHSKEIKNTVEECEGIFNLSNLIVSNKEEEYIRECTIVEQEYIREWDIVEEDAIEKEVPIVECDIIVEESINECADINECAIVEYSGIKEESIVECADINECAIVECDIIVEESINECANINECAIEYSGIKEESILECADIEKEVPIVECADINECAIVEESIREFADIKECAIVEKSIKEETKSQKQHTIEKENIDNKKIEDFENQATPPDDQTHIFSNRNCFMKFSMYLEIIQMYLKTHKCGTSKLLVENLKLIFQRIEDLKCMCDIEEDLVDLLGRIEECRNCG